MREIKFRAWDAEKGEMYSPTFEAYKGNLFDLFVSFAGDLSAHTMKGIEHESLWPNRFKLMQYTGLKDKKGVEIYEGDIIKYVTQYYGIRTERQKVVEWIEDMQDDSFGEPLSMGYRFQGSELEVIGNIYENPELLDKKS